jgi:hypothetical protein
VQGSEPGAKREIESIHAKDRRISHSLQQLKKAVSSATTPSRTDFLIAGMNTLHQAIWRFGLTESTGHEP